MDSPQQGNGSLHIKYGVPADLIKFGPAYHANPCGTLFNSSPYPSLPLMQAVHLIIRTNHPSRGDACVFFQDPAAVAVFMNMMKETQRKYPLKCPMLKGQALKDVSCDTKRPFLSVVSAVVSRPDHHGTSRTGPEASPVRSSKPRIIERSLLSTHL